MLTVRLNSWGRERGQDGGEGKKDGLNKEKEGKNSTFQIKMNPFNKRFYK
jgi:hypothetical protein